MTAHCSMKWSFGEPITDQLIKEVYDCVIGNYQYNQRTDRAGKYIPGAYGCFNLLDNFVFNICRYLDSNRENIEWLFENAPDHYKPQIEEICRKVIEKVEQFEKEKSSNV